MSRVRLAGRSPTLMVLAVFVALLVGFMAPTTAWASDGEEGRTGFLGGLDTLVNPDTSVDMASNPEQDYQEGYTPELREVGATELEDLDVNEGIASVVDRVNHVQLFGTTNRTLIECLPRFFTLFVNIFWAPAITMAFGWWAIRKTIRMIMGASKGKEVSV